MLKASEVCPRTNGIVGETFQSALPPGTVNVIANAPADAGDVVGAPAQEGLELGEDLLDGVQVGIVERPPAQPTS